MALWLLLSIRLDPIGELLYLLTSSFILTLGFNPYFEEHAGGLVKSTTSWLRVVSRCIRIREKMR